MNDIDQLKAKLSELHKLVEKSGKHLSRVLKKLIDDKILPDESLDGILTPSKECFQEICESLFKQFQTLKIKPILPDNSIISINQLDDLLSKLEEVKSKASGFDKTYKAALLVLEKVKALVHKEGIETPALTKCKKEADKICNEIKGSSWSNIHPDQVLIAEGKHPLARFIKLIEESDKLSEEECGSIMDCLSETYGNTIGIAAFRGKLCLDNEQKHLHKKKHSTTKIDNKAKKSKEILHGPEMFEFFRKDYE